MINDHAAAPILVYRFHEAPAALQALSPHGGDEDWLAVIPPHLAETWIGWMEPGTSYGCCDVSEHPYPGKPGYLIRIGCHS